MPELADGFNGTVIVCPGGNYEFLVPGEGTPVVDQLAKHGIRAFVLKYRLLPRYGLKESLEDLCSNIAFVRSRFSGPVGAFGFSAGGHLVACSALKAREELEQQSKTTGRGAVDSKNIALPLDAQVLIYPCIDGLDWGDTDDCAFSNFDETFPNPKAQTLLYGRDALLGGPGFVAPPTFMVASIADETAPPGQHADLYARSLKARSVPCSYLRKDFGPHGFGLNGGWTEQCVSWLRTYGFGESLAMNAQIDKLGRAGA